MTDYEKGYSEALRALRERAGGSGNADSDSGLPFPFGVKSPDGRQDGSGKGEEDKAGSSGGNAPESGSTQEKQCAGGADGQNSTPQSGAGDSTGPSRQEIDDAMGKAVAAGEYASLTLQLDEMASRPGGSNMCRTLRENLNRASEVVNGLVEAYNGKYGTAFIRKAKGNPARYRVALRAVKRYIPAMSKALRCRVRDRDWELYGEKSGKLDTNRLAGLRCGNTAIFRRKGMRTSEGISICILIDESGSMNGRRESAARETAVLINEAVSGMANIECFTYGFGGNRFDIFRENGRGDRTALGSNGADGGTPTHTALHIAQQRIRKVTGNKVLMIVITDGMPSRADLTRAKIEELKKDGFTVVGVDICGSEAVSGVFSDCVVTDDIANLAPNLTKIVTRRIFRTMNTYEV